MFLKKSLLFMTALALLIFAGQASAQSVSLTHVTDGTAGKASGQGTEIVVEVSQTGITQSVNAIQVDFEFDTSLLTLNAPAGWTSSGDKAVALLSITPVPVPASARFTFTTKVDVAGMEFSIGINKVTLDAVTLSPSAVISFNGIEAALTSDGEINDAGEVVVDVAVPGLTGATTGAEIVFMVDPAGAAMLTGVMPAEGLRRAPMDGDMSLKLTVVGLPPVMLEGGKYGSVTFTLGEDATEVTISVASLTVFTADGMKRSVGGGMPLTIVQLDPYLEASVSEPVTVLPGGSGMATVTAMDVGDLEVAFALGEGSSEGVTLASDGATATVSASGAGTAIVTATVGPRSITPDPVTVEFVWGPLTLTASDADPVKPGGSSSVTLTVSGQAEGAEVSLALGEGAEGVTLDAEAGTVSASGAGMGTVTASVGDVMSNSVDVVFEQGPLTLTADATEVAIGADGAMATLTASGQADGADVVFEGATENDDGVSATVSASVASTATVTASVGDVMSNAVEVSFVPSLQTESTEVVFDDFGASASASVTAVGFDEGAVIKFSYEATADFQAMEDGASLMITTASAGTVTVTATDGTASASLMITFSDPAAYLKADNDDVVIPEGGSASVTVSATGLEGVITYMISKTSGTASVASDTDGDMVTITASGAGSAMVSVTASAGGMTTKAVDILFRAMPTVGSDAPEAMVPQATVPSATSMVVATGFPEGAEITFNVEMTSGSASDLGEPMKDGNVLTLTATGSVSVSVTATAMVAGVEVTTSPVMVTFEQETPGAPASVAVEDQAGDNGYYVMVSFANSANHGDVSQYRVYREMMVTSTMGADGSVVVSDEPMAAWVPWAVIDAMDNDGMTRAVVPVTDAMATRWGVAAEAGQESAEEVITPAGKRVFTKESVQQMAQFLGLDPNRIVSEDALAQMFMPSADYINSIIGGRNVVFAALDPDLSVLMGDTTIPQNIRTGAVPILSSPITATEGMVAALDDTAPAAVTDVAADAETGMVTWTMSADDMIVGMINYRGYAMPIPGVIGYKVMGGASEDAMIDIGVVPAGSSSFQVPLALIESLINQGLPAVLVTVTAMDGTNMTPSVPLVVELIPTRKPFVDADGGPVYVVKLDRHGAMTPLLVDFEDFVAFTMAFNTDETHENWRVFVQADLNDDKMVNFEDFILFFGSYGKEAQGPAGKSLVTPSLGVNEVAELTLRLGSDRVVVGENMFVDVSLANVQALMGYGFVLNYDAEKFEFVEAMPAAEDFLASSGGETPLFRGWSPESGQVHVTNTIANGSEVSGSGDIVRLVFRVLRDFQDDARFEIAEGLVFDPSQFANPLAGGVLDIQTTPTEFALLQNFPNPFNPETTIGYELAESADVTLQIYNVVGQVVRTLMASESQSVGRYQVRWDGMDDRGMPVSSGIYFYQLSAGKFQDVRKLMLLK